MVVMVRVEIFTAICLSGHTNPTAARRVTDRDRMLRMPEATGFSAKRRADMVSDFTQPTSKAADRPISRALYGISAASLSMLIHLAPS